MSNRSVNVKVFLCFFFKDDPPVDEPTLLGNVSLSSTFMNKLLVPMFKGNGNDVELPSVLQTPPAPTECDREEAGPSRGDSSPQL